jgi:hypothetical protein
MEMVCATVRSCPVGVTAGGEIAFFSDGGVAIGQKRLTERLWFPRMPFGRIRLYLIGFLLET